jgi:hypothetical protein
LQSVGDRLQLFLELLDLSPELSGVLRGGDRRRQYRAERKDDQGQCAHPDPPGWFDSSTVSATEVAAELEARDGN